MKKILAIVAIFVFASSFSSINLQTVNSSNAAIVKTVAGDVPEVVLATYGQIVTDVMNNWYPGNSGWDDSQVSWERVRGDWVCSGFVGVNGTSSGIMIVDGVFKNTGDFIRLNYNPIP